MFSKLTILVYCLPFVVYILNWDLAQEWVKICTIACYALAYLALFISYSLKVNIIVEIGKAPVERLIIAYRFAAPSESEDELNCKIKEMSKNLPPLKRIFFYYTTSDMVPLGSAGGIILNDEISHDSAKRKALVKAGFRLVTTPPVSHAVFSVYPTISWFRMTEWLACYRTYPEIHYYCEKHNLSAYPMVEIYDKNSVLFFAPLSRQDAFVVPEAEDVIMRAKIKLDELETEVSGSEAEVSGSEVEASDSEASGSAASDEEESERASTVSSTISGSTKTWSYHSTYDKFSDDEDDDHQNKEHQQRSLLRRSLSKCAQTVKSILGLQPIDEDSVSETLKEGSPSIYVTTLVNDESVASSSANVSITNRSKSVNDITEDRPKEAPKRSSFRRSISRIVDAFNLMISSSPVPDDSTHSDENHESPLTTEVKLEIKTSENMAQCSGSCAQSSTFQVPTVSFVGA